MTDSEAADCLIQTKLKAVNQKQNLMDRGLSDAEADSTLAIAKKTMAQEATTAATNEYASANSCLKTALKGVEDAILSCNGNVENLTQAYKDMKRAANDAIISKGNKARLHCLFWFLLP